MQVDCPTCGTRILSEDMNLANMVAKCRGCNALVNLKDFLPQTTQQSSPPANRQRPAVPMPQGFTVDDSGPGPRIIRRWFGTQYIFLAFFCFAWDSFLIFWYSMAFGGNAPWIFIVFPICHLAIGIGLTYSTLAGFLNRTVIGIDADELTIRHGPLPWLGNWRLATEQIDQLYSEQQANSSKNGTTFTYKVNAVTKEGKKLTLLSGLMAQDQALFIEQQLENRLGIKDRPVPGELSR